MHHLHPKLSDSNRNGQRKSTWERSGVQAVDQCFNCILSQRKDCPRGLKKCEERTLGGVYLKYLVNQRSKTVEAA